MAEPAEIRGTAAPRRDESQPLSQRELAVAALLARGFTNVQMADQLGLTVHAVKFHLASIYRKLGVSNRTEAAVAYLGEVQAASIGREA